MKVAGICSRHLVSAPANAPLSEIARLLSETHVGAVVVTKSPLDRPVATGIITDRDVMRAQLERTADLNRLRAEDVMTRDPLVISEETEIEDAIRQMRARGVRRAPVVSEHGVLTGLVSTDDLVAQVARELIAIARVLEQQPRHETGRLERPGSSGNEPLRRAF